MRHYTKEFKDEAVKLVIETGYSESEIARRLGMNSKNVNRWVRERKAEVLVKKGKLTGEQEELARLRKENERLRMEKEILKKAATFFANERN
ncbi:MAG: hypothetical protein A3B69_01310 [Gammaproteobacteria bacterium RIFCSPHIGHO2_02_FULL_38_33]|nr:MAG: hypothetical protein A3B69_01310 [Gammaproteobacteria bacterium RIFCSPHIGHO2_02_FULL_38_33]